MTDENDLDCSFEFNNVTEDEVKSVMSNIKSKTSSGYDHISTTLKIAKVVPIFKKKDNMNIENIAQYPFFRQFLKSLKNSL